ncbi:MAG: hypothetical protein ABW098_17715 [Candidatus Thiodiazotropha sp.]
MSSERISRKLNQYGNATVETILIGTVMVPLLTGLPLLGKISDINNTVTQSSRYVAWEQTIAGPNYKSAQVLEEELRARFYADPDLQIRTDRQQLSEEEGVNPFWAGYGFNDEGEVNRLISYGDGPGVGLNNDSPDSLAGTLSEGIVTIGRGMARITGGDWQLEANGLYTANVSLDVASNAYLVAGSDCSTQESETVSSCITRSNTIFVDSWDAGNAAMAGERSRTFVPAGVLEPVGDVIATFVGAIPFFADIRGLESDNDGGFGYVNPNVLPMDRYAGD